jgi:hypothetical protein
MVCNGSYSIIWYNCNEVINYEKNPYCVSFIIVNY